MTDVMFKDHSLWRTEIKQVVIQIVIIRVGFKNIYFKVMLVQQQSKYILESSL
jgi:hypothetical protein